MSSGQAGIVQLHLHKQRARVCTQLHSHMHLPTARASGDAHVCSPAISAAWFRTAQSLVVGHGLGVGERCHMV